MSELRSSAGQCPAKDLHDDGVELREEKLLIGSLHLKNKLFNLESNCWEILRLSVGNVTTELTENHEKEKNQQQ